MFFRRLIACVCAAGALGACSVVPSSTEAFSVDGNSWSRETFNEFLSELIGVGQITETETGATGEEARSVATILIRQEATNAFLAEQGEQITDQDRASILDTINAGDPFFSYSETLQDSLLEINLTPTVLGRIAMPSAAQLEALYNTLPARAGVVCMSHIVVKTRDQANAALRRVNSGEKFADVAKDVSIEPAAQQTGGALENQSQDNPCFTLTELRQANLDPDFVAGALSARAGIPTGPVKSSFGYHIIMNAPWNDVSDAVTTLVKEAPGAVLNEGFLISSKVSVSSSIGRWNIVSGQVE